MADILVRNLDTKTVKRLKEQAKLHRRSLQGEAKLILERAARTGTVDIGAMVKRWRKRFAGRRFSDSAELIREDRER